MAFDFDGFGLGGKVTPAPGGTVVAGAEGVVPALVGTWATRRNRSRA